MERWRNDDVLGHHLKTSGTAANAKRSQEAVVQAFRTVLQPSWRLQLNLTKEKSNCNELFDTTLVDGYLNWKDVRRFQPGFINLGNSCYFNAAIQCLFAVPPFFQLLVQDDVKLGKQDDPNGILATLRR